jgi:hypothetical protein
MIVQKVNLEYICEDAAVRTIHDQTDQPSEPKDGSKDIHNCHGHGQLKDMLDTIARNGINTGCAITEGIIVAKKWG